MRSSSSEAPEPMETAFTRLSGATYPIANAGMSYVAGVEMVVAVSDAGGYGVLGGINYSPNELREAIREIQRRTDRPFGVDLVGDRHALEPPPEFRARMDAVKRRVEEVGELHGELANYLSPERMQEQIQVVFDEHVPVLVSALGDPSWLVPLATRAGAEVWAVVGNARQARRAAAGGATVIIAQGYDGGGHTGVIGTLSLVREAAATVDVPVLAAGGIGDGHGLAAALSLGAAGAWVGTRFVACHEAEVHANFVARVLAATMEDSVITRSYTGRSARALKDEWIAQYAGREHELEYPDQIAVSAKVVFAAFDSDRPGMVNAGQGVGLVNEMRSSREIIHGMVNEARAVLGGLASI
ncbi:MAG: enoyl-[acyl-carrier protein] reductase [Chloroflexota bacterium]|jgi:NAD(P)H-dependent flavin oxidoreductase YrpB (nitropropane dioxygenase family)|nr:enoyl-[acyl-carrier protein] reductase [Chloroflexota bacterium]